MNIDPAAAKQRMQQILSELAAVPVEVLQEAKRRQDIEEHNAKVDAKRRAKGKR